MTKLESVEHKIFASEAPLDEIGQFGSALDTTKLNTKDVTTIQALPAYTKGWGSAIISDNDYPTMEEMNGVLNVMSYHTGYLYQEGMPAWRSDREYSATSIVKEPTGTKFFRSLKDGNIGNTLDNTEYWEELTFGGSGLELCDIGTALYVDETKGLRRRLNGSIMDITSNYQAFLTRLKEITTLYPSLVCTETEWQTIKTMSKLGQCGKFVYNYGADGTTITSIRLPLVININGLVDMANAGLIKDESLPNIKGGVKDDVGEGGGKDYTGAISLIESRNNPIWQGAQNVKRQRDWDFNASRVSSTYQDNAPVQQEAIQYPYFIQVATGSETENNIVNDIELNNPYSLFDSKYSDYELNNLSWLKSSGQWNAKAVYPDAYDKLLKVYNGTETVKGLSVKLSTEEYTDYDFVLNTTDETFRLPLKTKLASGKAVVGNGKAMVGLRNLTSPAISQPEFYFGKNPKDDNVTIWNSVQAQSAIGITTDPTKSGIETSDSGLYLYFYVGETVQNANLIDAGRIGEQLANKIGRTECKAYITETYQNGSSWYRIYSDGWCEQGGYVSSASAITLLKSFKDTNYTITVALLADVNKDYTSKTTTGFSIGASGSWQASGYIV